MVSEVTHFKEKRKWPTPECALREEMLERICHTLGNLGEQVENQGRILERLDTFIRHSATYEQMLRDYFDDKAVEAADAKRREEKAAMDVKLSQRIAWGTGITALLTVAWNVLHSLLNKGN